MEGGTEGRPSSPTIELERWEDFDAKVEEISQPLKAAEICTPNFLFRGQADASFDLKTTLERYSNKECTPLIDYYGATSKIKKTIESFTERSWQIPTNEEFKEIARNSDFLSPVNAILTGDIYSYWTHLRHHGFPSPLLDWSRSKNVAAFFAFRSPHPPKTNKHEQVPKVSIYMYSEYVGEAKVADKDEPAMFPFGPNVKTHPRHFLQQSEYTICANFKDSSWHFSPHGEVFRRNDPHQDNLWKFNLPWSERTKVLKLLDNYNLNAYSLFNSEEALMESMAFRGFHS